MLIKSVKIKNFKRFENREITFKSFDCLVGPNNSGKTTLLQALALFDFCIHHCLSQKNGTLELKKRTIPSEEFYVIPVANPEDLWTDRRKKSRNKMITASVEVTFDNGIKVSSEVRLVFNKFGIAIKSIDESQEFLRELKDFRISYLPVFSMFLPQEERRTRAAVEAELSRGRVTSVIRNLLLDLKEQPKLLEELVGVLRRTFPTLKDMSIDFDEVNDRYISVTYKEETHPKEFDIFSAGSGFQQFIYLFGFTLLRQPKVILLDEPDVHLHGSLQQVLLDELKRLVDSGKQVLLATHSRDLISRIGPENLISLEEDGTHRLKIAFEIYDTLDRLGSVDPTQLPTVQAYQRVLVVEDRADRDLLYTFCSKCLGTSLWQQIERRLTVCYSKGNPWKQDMEKLRQQIQQMISLRGVALKMFVVADRDYYPDMKKLLDSLPSNHIEWHIWERAEIENYLLSLTGVRRLIGETTNQLTFDDTIIEEEFNRLVESSYDRANDLLIEAFKEYGKRENKNWDVVTLSQNAREYIKEHWEREKLSLADAKEIVLPGLKRWLQNQKLGQFSDKGLAELLRAGELPKEIHDLANNLASFVGVKTSTR
jgi:AAA15 family ATPase/GTPase